MVPKLHCTVFLLAALACSHAGAQIYMCKGADGSRIYSDEKCGPDAKPVPNLSASTPKRPATKSKAKSEPPKKKVYPPKSPAELEVLLERCNAGDNTACMSWTQGGGPNQLREKERADEIACQGGSLSACETRYCADGASEECRTRVLGAAKLAGNTWYVRDDDRQLEDGSTTYSVRCMREGVRQMRDVAITCSPIAGPNRCAVNSGKDGFSRLSHAAQSYCDAK